MKWNSKIESRQTGAANSSPTKGLTLLIILCAMFTLCGMSAWAQGPVLNLPASVTVAEDGIANVPIGVTDASAPIFTVATVATSSNTNLISNATLTLGGAGTNRLLAIRPSLHASGTATITVVASDAQYSTTNTFALTITFTNYPPTFTSTITDQTVAENSSASSYSFGVSDIETAGSNLTLTATSANTALVPAHNLVITGSGASCNLAITPATNQSGTSVIQVVVTDGGGKKATNAFTLTVTLVNQPPTFGLSTNRIRTHEYTGPQTFAKFATGITAGPTNQSSEAIGFTLTPDTVTNYISPPAISASGTLTFQLDPVYVGTNTITVVLTNSGTGNNSVTKSFTLEVPAIAVQPPSFAFASNLVLVAEESGITTNSHFLTTFTNNGTTNDYNNHFTVTISTFTTNSTNASFKVLTVSTNGTITIEPNTHSAGTNTVTVVMTVAGTFTNGYIAATTNTFQIGVIATNHAPIIAGATNRTVLENATNTLTAAINVSTYDRGQSTNIVLTVNTLNSGPATISIIGTNFVSATNTIFTLGFALANNQSGTNNVQVIATEGPLSTTNAFNYIVTRVNQQPSFTLATNFITVGEETGVTTNLGFVDTLNLGPANQLTELYKYTLTTVSTNATNGAFTVLAVSTNGTLTLEPKVHTFGTNTITMVLSLTGTTGAGGVNNYTNTFQIGVTQTNHAPIIVGATNHTFLENSNNATALINVQTLDKGVSTNLTLTVTASNSLSTVTITHTNVQSATNSIFTLSFVLATNSSGTNNIKLVATEGVLSTTNSFNQIVTLVNHAPSFTLSSNVVLIGEETPLVTIPAFVDSTNKGPANQSSETIAYTVTTGSTNSTNAAFTTLALSPAGVLTVLPKVHSYGTNTVTLVMALSGGNANGGVNTATNTFQIEVEQTNHAPTIVGATNRTVKEFTMTNITINVTDIDHQSTNLVLVANSLSNELATVSVTHTNVASLTNAVFTVAIAPAYAAFGTVTLQMIASEGLLSTTNTFVVTISATNNAPNFSFTTNFVHVLEETKPVTNNVFVAGWKASKIFFFTNISTTTGDPTNAIFTTAPSLSTNATLTFAPATHSYGTNTVTVVLTDTTNFYTNSFEIGVAQINHAPFIIATDATVLENATNGTATVQVWDYDTQSSNIILTATSATPSAATVSITGTNLDGTGTNAVFTLAFTLGTNAVGTIPINLIATEDGLPTNGTFNLIITPVNQPPSFTVATNTTTNGLLLVAEETLLGTNFGVLTNLLAGPVNESNQTWTFTATTVTNDPTNAILSTLAISSNGTFTYALAPHSYGTNIVTVVMTDNGGTNNNGINGYTNTFEVGVVPIGHAPTIVAISDVTVLENLSNTTTTVSTWTYDLTQSTNITLTATSGSNGLATVSVTGTNLDGTGTNAVFTLTIVPTANASGTVPIQVVATEAGLSTTNSFNVIVTAVNQAPSFDFSLLYMTNNLLLIPEESPTLTNGGFLVSLLAGPPNEIGQTWSFTLTTVTTNSTNANITSIGADTNGNLSYTLAAHSFGTNTVMVVMTDSGGTANGGVNSYTNTFQIGVVPIEHAPVIVVATNVNILENVSGTNITVQVTDYDAISNFTLTATVSDPTLATVSIVTNATALSNVVYTMTLSPMANVFGTPTVTLTAMETGGTLTTTNSLTFTITPVNQAPSFGLSLLYMTNDVLLVAEESTPATNFNFLTSISAGPASEANQTWTFTVMTPTNDATNAQFSISPRVDPTGTLVFSPAPHTFGTNTITVVMTDNGGTANGGMNTATNTFQIGVYPVEHAPVIVATNITALENASSLTANFSIWDYDLTTNYIVTVTSSDTNLASVSYVTNAAGTSNVAYTLTLTPVANVSGTPTIQITAIETSGTLSTTNTVTFTIFQVDQPPTNIVNTNFVTNNALAVAENAGPQSFSHYLTNLVSGPGQESNLTYTFTVASVTNGAANVKFAQFPSVDTNGNLTFTTQTNSFGTNTVFVSMKNSGVTNHSGTNTFVQSFELDVTQVQYPPVMTGLTNVTTLENVATNLAFTIYDPLTTNFAVTAVAAVPSLVTPTLTGTGTGRTLTFTPVTNTSGTSLITIVVNDGLLRTTNTLTLTVLIVNHAPSFTLTKSSYTVDNYDVAVTVSNAVTNITGGPAAETNQTVSFIVTNSNPALFLVVPSVDASGTLAFTPHATGGTVTVGIKAQDSGGTANGGTNGSPVQFVTIVIPANPFPYLTNGAFAGLFYDTNLAANASSGYFNLQMVTNGTFSGYTLCAGASNTFSGQFDISNSTATATSGVFNLSLYVDTTELSGSLSGTLSNTVSTTNSILQSYVAGYSTTLTTPLAGGYTMTLPGFTNAAEGPAGDSIFSLIISNNGTALLSGMTADSTNVSQLSQISVDGFYPLYVPLYNNGTNGSLIGWIDVTGDVANAVSSDSTITWFAEAGATALYASGFTNQGAPIAAPYNPSATAALSFSSGTVILGGGNLLAPVTNTVTISGNIIIVNPQATNGLTLTISASTGEINGYFTAPGNITNSIESVILQNSTNAARGYFLGTSQGGSFSLFGN